MVEIVPLPRLARSSAATAVVGDHAVSPVCNEFRGAVPGVSGERPPVTEDDWLAVTPVLVKDVHIIGCCDYGHRVLLATVVRSCNSTTVASTPNPGDTPVPNQPNQRLHEVRELTNRSEGARGTPANPIARVVQ